MSKTKKPVKLNPPKHLSAAAAKWIQGVESRYEVGPDHRKLLIMAGESWDLAEQARQFLAVNGLTYDDRFGQPHARPEVAILRDSRLTFTRILRQLDLDEEPKTPVSATVGGRIIRGKP